MFSNSQIWFFICCRKKKIQWKLIVPSDMADSFGNEFCWSWEGTFSRNSQGSSLLFAAALSIKVIIVIKYFLLRFFVFSTSHRADLVPSLQLIDVTNVHSLPWNTNSGGISWTRLCQIQVSTVYHLLMMLDYFHRIKCIY